MLYGSHDERKLIVGIRHLILRTGNTSPAVFATEPCLLQVDAHVGEIGLLHFCGMPLLLIEALVQRLDGVVQCRSREGSFGHDAQAVSSCVEHVPPAYIGLRARLLRADIGIELLVHALAVYAEVGAVVAVCVVLDRPAAIILYRLERTGHGHLHAETEHVGHFRALVHGHLLGNFDGTHVIDHIGQLQLGRNARLLFDRSLPNSRSRIHSLSEPRLISTRLSPKRAVNKSYSSLSP